MTSEGSVTGWLDGAKAGRSSAAEALWGRYFPKLVRLARDKLQAIQGADEEDVALSAMDSFLDAARNGRFPDLADREGLWRLLVQMTVRKAIDMRRHETRQRRGSGACRREADLQFHDDDATLAPLAEVIDQIPTAEVAALMTEQYLRLLDLLGDDELRRVAVARMEGYTNQEIAAKMDCAVRTVERRLNLIRMKWEQERVA